jgi:hypothetical protein
MDRTIKFLLGVIAASLLMLNLQLAGVSLVKDAHAELYGFSSEFKNISGALNNIASSISGIDCGS